MCWKAAVKAGVKKVVAASSVSVYGMAEEFPTAEHHRSYNNRTLYGAAKIFNEGLLRSFLRDVRVELCSAAVFQCVRVADGYSRCLH